MILHIPHSSDSVPEQHRDLFVLSEGDLNRELRLLTDAYTDELYALPGAVVLKFPISRLVVDVERFSDDAQEPMSKVGMGVIYTKTTGGNPLKRDLQPVEKKQLLEYYNRHHRILTNEVNMELKEHGRALIVDCHSFPDIPLPTDMDKKTPRPDFCIGTDSFHTPAGLVKVAEQAIRDMGYGVDINWPYRGSIVPMEFFGQNSRVKSIMIEINRKLYMDEVTGLKNGSFETAKDSIETILKNIATYE